MNSKESEEVNLDKVYKELLLNHKDSSKLCTYILSNGQEFPEMKSVNEEILVETALIIQQRTGRNMYDILKENKLL
jgi:hypothetical protein